MFLSKSYVFRLCSCPVTMEIHFMLTNFPLLWPGFPILCGWSGKELKGGKQKYYESDESESISINR